MKVEKMLNNSTPIEIEEFRYVADRKKMHESDSRRLYLFCITSFVTIIGFSEKIPSEIIPYLLIYILLATYVEIWHITNLKHFNSAYMAEKFYTNEQIGYEKLFNVWCGRNRKEKNVRKYKRVLGAISSSLFALMLGVTVYSVFHFGTDILQKDIHSYFKFAYFLGIVLLYILLAFKAIRINRYSYFDLEQFMKSHIKNRFE